MRKRQLFATRVATLAAVIVVGAVLTSTHAQPPPQQCVFYDRSEALSRLLPNREGSTIQRCTYGPALITVVETTRAERSAAGVCRFSRTEVVLQPDRLWKVDEFAVVADEPCPARNSRDYVEVIGISDEMYRSVSSFWQETSSSEQNFDLASPAAWVARDDFQRLRTLAVNRNPKLRLASVSKLGTEEYRLWFYNGPENLILTLRQAGPGFEFASLGSSVS
jgi:hypothetical protein